MSRLTASEFKILLFINDRTVQWGKDYELIPMRDFEDGGRKIRSDGTGLREGAIRRAINGLLDKGIILRDPGVGPSRRGAFGYEIAEDIRRKALNSDLIRYANRQST